MQDAAYEVHPWQEDVAQWLDSPWPETSLEGNAGKPKREVTTSEVLQDALGLSAAQRTRTAQMEVAAILKRLDWVKCRDGKGRKVWRRNRYSHLEVVK